MNAAALSDLSGLRFPEEMTGFRSVALDNDVQYDITFVIPARSVAPFLEDSGLPEPSADQRVLIHASPLWELNPPDGTIIRSTRDRYQDVDRAVELVSPDVAGSDDTTRDEPTTVRISLTPAG